jgi:mRNA interferase MazF
MATDYITLLVQWCCLKIILAFKRRSVVFKQGDIWWCSIGMNLGEEIYGKGPKYTRPVLVFKKLTGNSFLGLPLTSREKYGNWYVEITIHNRKSRIMLNQARMFDKRRLTKRIITLDSDDFSGVQEKFLELYS